MLQAASTEEKIIVLQKRLYIYIYIYYKFHIKILNCSLRLEWKKY